MYDWAANHGSLIKEIVALIEKLNHESWGDKKWDSTKAYVQLEEIVEVLYRGLDAKSRTLPKYIEAPVKIITMIYGMDVATLDHAFAVGFAVVLCCYATGVNCANYILDLLPFCHSKTKTDKLTNCLCDGEIAMYSVIQQMRIVSSLQDPNKAHDSLADVRVDFKNEIGIDPKLVKQFDDLEKISASVINIVRYQSDSLEQLFSVYITFVSLSNSTEDIQPQNYKLLRSHIYQLAWNFHKAPYLGFYDAAWNRFLCLANQMEASMTE